MSEISEEQYRRAAITENILSHLEVCEMFSFQKGKWRPQRLGGLISKQGRTLPPRKQACISPLLPTQVLFQTLVRLLTQS